MGSSHFPNTDSFAPEGQYRRLVILLFVVNVISALLFIGIVNRQVYDDSNNSLDVYRYAREGVSVDTIHRHINPTGPVSFIWMAEGIRILGGQELRSARIAILFSWVLLIAGVLIFARYARFPELWFGALLAALVFPHTVQSFATLLTEGPSLLFAVLGALAWLEFVSRPIVTRSSLMLGLAGGLSMGLAVTARQYNLALLPAAAVVALYQFLQHRQSSAREKRIWLVSVAATFILAALPVAMLIVLWEGFSSPGMAANTSYKRWQAAVGLNISRPLIAAFYAAVYFVPFTFPVMARVRRSARWGGLFIALLGGAVAGYFNASVLTDGPLRTTVRAVARFPGARGILLGLIAAVAIYNLFALCLLLWEKRDMVLKSPPVLFALLTILFFLAEQVGVGGNIPFYDRYLLSEAPFMGLIVFSVLPRLTYSRLFALAAMSVVGQVMLWRFALRA